MFNAFTVEQAMFSLLQESQNPAADTPFHLLEDLDFHNFDPGDFRVTGFLPNDGLYFSFASTELDSNLCEVGEQHHVPLIKVQAYSSRGATASEVSPHAAYLRAQDVIASIYGCMCHTMFRRLTEERAQLVVPGLQVPKVYVRSVKNVMAYPIVEQNTRTTVFWELIAEFQTVETPEQNPGIAISAVEDRLHVVREEGDIE